MERNALKGKLVKSADQWRWSSLYRWLYGSAAEKELLSAWPLPRKRSWLQHVSEPLTELEYEALQRCVQRGCPFGDYQWNARKIKQLGLESPMIPRGRPKNKNGFRHLCSPSHQLTQRQIKASPEICHDWQKLLTAKTACEPRSHRCQKPETTFGCAKWQR